VAEVAGALLARLLGQSITTLPLHFLAANWEGEFFGFGFLILAVLGVTGGYVPQEARGLAIGGGLLAGLLTTKGILNPSIAIAMGQITSAGWAIWAPIVGALVFATIFRAFASFDITVPAVAGTVATPQRAQSVA
jgi:aquaporin Z